MEKKCKLCEEVKSITNFNKNGFNKDNTIRYINFCHKCFYKKHKIKKNLNNKKNYNKEKQNQYYLNNKETIIKYQKEYSINNRDKINKRFKEYKYKS